MNFLDKETSTRLDIYTIRNTGVHSNKISPISQYLNFYTAMDFAVRFLVKNQSLSFPMVKPRDGESESSISASLLVITLREHYLK